MKGTLAVETGRVVRLSIVACLVGAALVVVGASLMGRSAAGIALAIGMTVGAGNGYIARRLVSSGVPFGVTSMARITTLTMIAVSVGALFGFGRVWLVILGVGIAQLLMAGSAFREMKRR